MPESISPYQTAIISYPAYKNATEEQRGEFCDYQARCDKELSDWRCEMSFDADAKTYTMQWVNDRRDIKTAKLTGVNVPFMSAVLLQSALFTLDNPGYKP